MLAVTASRFSPSDMWRKPKDEGAKGILTVGSWRERRVSQESGEKKGMLGNWRMREQKEAAEADRPKAVYGGSMPPEWKLVGMYKQMKVDNAEFTNWLVESVYPSVESLPSYITLSNKQAESEFITDPSCGDIELSSYYRQQTTRSTTSSSTKLPSLHASHERFHEP